MTTRDIQQAQRGHLAQALSAPLERLARECAAVWELPAAMDTVLTSHLAHLPRCRLLYTLDADGIQHSANVRAGGAEDRFRGQDLSQRPLWPGEAPPSGLSLSAVYVDQHDGLPCITALAAVPGPSGPRGYVAADFALHDLHLPAPEPGGASWAQYRGDPAIRGTLFLQQRAETGLEAEMDRVLGVIETLFAEGGIFHAKIHFSGSRVTLWGTADPFRYHVHTLEEMRDPELFLAYPAPAEPPCPGEGAERVAAVLERFKELRRMDDTLYLRAGSLNLCNELVGLNFSCDGTHYLGVGDFLAKGMDFWIGEGGVTA
jgi:hypothetical protein